MECLQKDPYYIPRPLVHFDGEKLFASMPLAAICAVVAAESTGTMLSRSS